MLMFEMMAHAVAESAKLAALRDCLLPRLLSGRVRVPVAERMLGDVNHRDEGG